MSYYPETDSHNRNKITVGLDMYNTSEFPKKTDLISLKTKVDKIRCRQTSNCSC